MKFYNLSFHVVPLTLLQKWPKVMQTWIVLGLVSISCTCMTNILYAYFVTAPNQEFLAIIEFPITLLFALQTTHLLSLSWHVINIWLLWCLWGWTILRYSVIQIRGSFIKYTVWNWPRKVQRVFRRPVLSSPNILPFLAIDSSIHRVFL